MSKAPPPGMRFEEPPKRHPYDWDQVSQAIRAQPMQWLKVFDRDKHSLSVAIRRGSIKALRPETGVEYQTDHTTYDDEGKRLCTLRLRYNPALDTTRSNGKAKQ